MKKKIAIAVLLIAVAAGCFLIGQHNVKKSLFAVSKEFSDMKSDSDSGETLFVQAGKPVKGKVDLGSSYITLKFDYEVILKDGHQIPEDANLEVRGSIPEGDALWGFEPGTMQTSGSVTVDLKNLKGHEIDLKFTCKGGFAEDEGIVIKNAYVTKMYE